MQSKRFTGVDSSFLQAPLRVTWDITNLCNLRCIHCYNFSGAQAFMELGGRELLKVASSIAEGKVLITTLSGGEPLLKRELWDVISLLTEKKVHVNLITNGTLLTQHAAKRLRDHKISEVQVSLDGLDKTHDEIRGVPGAFTKAVNGIKALVQHGLHVLVSMMILRKNVKEVESVLKLSIKLGAQGFRALRFIPMGRGGDQFKEMLSPIEMKQLTMGLIGLREACKEVIDVQLDETIAFLDEKEREKYGLRWNGCLAARREAAVDPCGNLYPCVFLEYPEFCAGNLIESSVKDLWSSKAFTFFRKLNKRCVNCDVVSCDGGCVAVSYAVYGSFQEADPYCWRHRK